MKDELNEQELDRMVDGELDNEEQSRLLRACEDDPTQWRSLALAYVEAQTWRFDLSQIRDESQRSELALTPKSQETRRSIPVRRLLNVAAMLLLSLTIGFGMGALSFTTPSDDMRQQVASQESDRNPARANEEIVVLVQNQETSQLEPMKVPLVNMSEINTGLNGHHRIPSDLWRSLQEEGHEVSHQRQWYPVQLKDGRSALVPIDNLRVMFEGFQ